MVAYELDNDIEAHVVVNKGTITCGVFNNVRGRFCSTHDEESKYALV